MQSASRWQLSVPVRHSSISSQAVPLRKKPLLQAQDLFWIWSPSGSTEYHRPLEMHVAFAIQSESVMHVGFMTRCPQRLIKRLLQSSKDKFEDFIRATTHLVIEKSSPKLGPETDTSRLGNGGWLTKLLLVSPWSDRVRLPIPPNQIEFMRPCPQILYSQR